MGADRLNDVDDGEHGWLEGCLGLDQSLVRCVRNAVLTVGRQRGETVLQVGPRYTAIGVTVDGQRDILGLWIGAGGEGAKYWLQVLTEMKNRGVEDVCIVVCDGLKGLPDAIAATWPLALTQTCVLHLIRNTFRLASRKDWDKMAGHLRPDTAVNEADAARCLDEFHAIWGNRFPAIRTLSTNAWAEFVIAIDEPRRLLDYTRELANSIGKPVITRAA